MNSEPNGQSLSITLSDSTETEEGKENPNISAREPRIQDFSEIPSIPRRVILKEVPSGEIAIEQGADGIFLRFDCDCMHALPYCQAQCCGLIGTAVFQEELELVDYPCEWDDSMGCWVLSRDSDGFCTCLDREHRLCSIYEDRPRTCKEFHCTRGASQRGWKIPNSVYRQAR